MPADDDVLLQQFESSRDEAAFRNLYRRHTPLLFALGLRLTRGAAADAEELVQDTWVRAVENLDRFQRKSSLRTWLSGILVNCHRELLRSRSKTSISIDDDQQVQRIRALGVLSTRASSAEAMDLERALAELPNGYREVVLLHDVNGHTHREIARFLEIDEGTSKSQLARGRARLRATLKAPASDDTSLKR